MAHEVRPRFRALRYFEPRQLRAKMVAATADLSLYQLHL